MEPRIQYATTSDGVSIAYSVIGDGVPLVHMPEFPTNHLQMEWQVPEIRRWYERLAEKRMLVRHDGRGTGLSERDVVDFSLDARILDLEAVVDRLDLERFVLFGTLHSGPVAIAYAARHPERVSHLVLWCTFALGSDWLQSPQVQAVRGLVDKDWETFTETAAHAFMTGWEAGEFAHRVAVLFRESITQQAFQAFIPTGNAVDVTELLPQVRVPTLVVHRRQLSLLSVDVARRLAARIPDARLALLEGESIFAYIGDMEAAAMAMDEFVGEGEEARGPAVKAPAEAGAFRTILFSDIEGSTGLTERLGDAKAREVLREHERIVREALSAHGGSEVKTMGDGFMASFGSATKALECAVAIQRATAVGARQPPDDTPARHEIGTVASPLRPAREPGPDSPIRVRIGLNAGEPIAEDDPGGRGDLFGTAVNMAARIAAQAQGREILVSDVVRQLVAGKGFLFADRGETAMKGFEEMVRVYEVKWRED